MSEAAAADRRLHPGTILVRFAKEAPSVLALPAGLAFLSDAGLGRAILVAAAIGAVMAAMACLFWWRFRYGVGAGEIVIEKGLLARTRRVIPFDRIQDVDIERALLARLFGLAKVRIETGAGGKDEGVLDSVSVAEADRIRGAVRAFRTGAAPADEGEGTPPAGRVARVVFEMGIGRVLLSGLFNFSLVYIAGFFGLLQTFDQFLPFDPYDPARWLGLVGPYLPGRFTIAAILAVLFLAALLGFVAGMLRTLARDFGFRLLLEGERFRREHGLLTRSEAVIARARVQLAHIQTGPLRRLLGWADLSFQTLGAGTGDSGRQAAAPFARPDEIGAVLAAAGRYRLPPPPHLVQVSQRHIVRALARYVAPLALVLGLSLWDERALLLLLPFPFLAVSAALERRFHRYAIEDGLLFVAAGPWRQQLWIVPLGNVQALSLSRTWLQRRLGLATLAVDTAGAPALKGPRIVDVRLETGRGLAEAISAGRAAYSSGRKSGTDK